MIYNVTWEQGAFINSWGSDKKLGSFSLIQKNFELEVSVKPHSDKKLGSFSLIQYISKDKVRKYCFFIFVLYRGV